MKGVDKMLKKSVEMKVIEELCPEDGKGLLKLVKLSDYFEKPAKLRTFAYAELEPGAEVGYHVHSGESESYYILSGNGMYNDNGVSCAVTAGDVTFTPDGTGHGLKNTGSEKLCFIALIILD